MEQEIINLLSEQVADYINTYIVMYNFEAERSLSTFIEENGIYFATPNRNVHLSQYSKFACKIKIERNSRTSFSIYYKIWNDSQTEIEDAQRLIDLISGYIDFDARMNAHGRLEYIRFTLEFGCKSNAELFFKNIKAPNQHDFGGMIT